MIMAIASTQLASVRYLIDDVDRAVDFYTIHLGFSGPVGQQILLHDSARNPVELFHPANR
jgi:catechol 2,3-dioxygenase-like lactoylglutathione lyase family enzyme